MGGEIDNQMTGKTMKRLLALAALLPLLTQAQQSATLTWVNPTEWEDGTPYDNPGHMRIKYQANAVLVEGDINLGNEPCQSGRVYCVTVPWPGDSVTLDNLLPGEWQAIGYAVSGPQGPENRRIFSRATLPAYIMIEEGVRQPRAPTQLQWSR